VGGNLPASRKKLKVKIKKGQIWQDWDCRFRNSKPRLIQVVAIHKHNYLGEFYVTCRNIDTDKITNIKLRRFKPNSTGYKLWREL
jgi:hypothetical protein